jgi:hypothetical protein
MGRPHIFIMSRWMLLLAALPLVACASASPLSASEASATAALEDDVEDTAVQQTFTVGGFVSGLVAIGLVLENNHQGAIALSKDGMFVFLSPVRAGSPYSVTIAQQPDGQTCKVLDGEGTVTTNVTSVTVTCTDDQRTLEGSVTGLTGNVVLSNGEDLVSVLGDGIFTLPARVAIGVAFDVEVFAQPTDPPQTCVVTGGQGRMTSEGTSMKVACAVAVEDAAPTPAAN